MIITLDGPAGSGKSTLARKLAQHFDMIYLDTGALYRIVSFYALEQGILLDDGNSLGKVARELHFEFRYDKFKDVQSVYACLPDERGMRDLTQLIRSPQVDAIVSQVSSHLEVRSALLELQRSYARSSDVVAEGRDLGSVVFPHAELKVYLYADPRLRAHRRYEQNREKYEQGLISELLSEEEIYQDMVMRDNLDQEKRHSPLCIPEGAIMLDSSYMTEAEVLKRLQELVEQRR